MDKSLAEVFQLTSATYSQRETGPISPVCSKQFGVPKGVEALMGGLAAALLVAKNWAH